MTKHTPGPWRAVGERVLEADTNDVIAQPGRNFSLINPSQTLEANARLIAGAQDLLEAAHHAAMSIHHPACDHIHPKRCTCHVEKARAAIAETTT